MKRSAKPLYPQMNLPLFNVPAIATADEHQNELTSALMELLISAAVTVQGVTFGGSNDGADWPRRCRITASVRYVRALRCCFWQVPLTVSRRAVASSPLALRFPKQILRHCTPVERVRRCCWSVPRLHIPGT